MPSILVRSSRQDDAADVICPGLKVSLLRPLVPFRPRNNGLRRIHKSQQSLATPYANRLVIGDFTGLRKCISGFLNIPVGLRERFDGQIRQLLAVLAGDSQTQSNMKRKREVHVWKLVSKLEPDISVLSTSDSEYRQFVHVWMALYQRYRIAIDAIDIGDYPYRVRIFDKILWLIGEPRYGPREALPE
jgi:hypothetical protein